MDNQERPPEFFCEISPAGALIFIVALHGGYLAQLAVRDPSVLLDVEAPHDLVLAKIEMMANALLLGLAAVICHWDNVLDLRAIAFGETS